jgi:PAS domain S-box-containing protein
VEELKSSGENYRELFNTMTQGIVYQDSNGKIISANPAAEKILGLSYDQMIGRTSRDPRWKATHEDGSDFIENEHPSMIALKKGKIVKDIIMKVYNPKTNRYHWINISAVPQFKGGNKHPYQVYTIFEDITERKNNEEMLKKNESRLNRTQEIAHLGSWELDLTQNHLTWSDEVYRIFGLQPQEFDATYEAFLEAVHPEDRGKVDNTYNTSLREKKDGYEIEHRILRKNGEIRYVYEKCQHVYDESGHVIQSIGMVQDITEQKQLNEKINYLAAYPQLNPSPVLEVDQSGVILYQNPATQKLFPNLTTHAVDHPFFNSWKQVIKELKKNNWSKNIIREVSINKSYYQQMIAPYEKNKMRIYAVDITKLKQVEEELRKSEEKYRKIVENTTNLIMMTQPDGIISYLSPSSKNIIGYTPEDLTGTNPDIFHPDDMKEVQRALSKALKGEKGSNFEYRIITKSGDVKWISHSWSPIIIDNKLQCIISVIEDITEQKEIDNKLRSLNDNLIRRSFELAIANKELEAFSYSVSHDLRAPLRSIDGFSQALAEDYTAILDEQGKEYILRVRKASQRMGQLIDDLLKLSRLTRKEMTIEPVNLSKIASSILDTYKKEEPKRKVDLTIHNNLVVNGDPNFLRILLENLLGNAWKFTKKCKVTKIEFGKKQKEKETIFFIRDNGAGFNMKYADKLFIPFQRLHDQEYSGTGIGLSIVSRIIRRHEGRIWAESKENKGTTFYFTIGGRSDE